MSLSDLIDDPTARPWSPHGEGTVRFAVVGVGWWAREYALPALAQADGTTPTVLVTRRPDRVTDLETAYSSLERVLTYEDFADGVGATAYDAAYVATPNGVHLDHVEHAVAHGADVLCEKPLEKSVDRAARLAHAVEEAGCRLMVGYRMQTDPTIRRLRTLIRSGFLGTPRFAHSHMSQRMLELIGPDTWRLDPSLAGRGASVTDLGVYPLNTLRFLLDADPTHVVASGASTHPAFDEVPDEHAQFELRSEGWRASCSVSQNSQLTGWLNLVGTDGAIELSPAFYANDEQSLRLSRGDEVHQVRYTPRDQMRELFAFFADRLLTDEPFEADGDHARFDMRAIDAVYDAIESGDCEPISDPS